MFQMANLESACPLPGRNTNRILPRIDTIENMDRIRTKEAEPFLKIENIRFMSARFVKSAFIKKNFTNF